MTKKKLEEYKVSATSKPSRVAEAIIKGLNSGSEINMYAIGPQAVNQALKAAILARDKMEFSCTPSFCEISFPDSSKTGIKFSISA